MKRHILCLGDSNTYGYSPEPALAPACRFSEEERWTGRLQAALGPDYLVIEEGLPGRTTVFDDPVEEGMSALPYLYPCLMSHAPVGLLVLMLGTNDVKERLGANAYAIAKGLRRVIQRARGVPCWAGTANILVVAPLCLGEEARPHAQELQQLMDRAREGAETGQALSRRAGNWSRSLAALASDHRRALRQLSAAYFLITGQRHRPAQPALSLNPSLPLALRDQFVWEQRWERDCRRAAEGCSDPCLGELYQELARDGTLHAAVIRSLLEQM